MNNSFNFNWKFGHFQITTVHEKYDDKNHCYDVESPIRKNCPIELLKWSEDFDYCWVVAWFRKTDEGYEFLSIGSRLFDEISEDEISEIWRQLKAASKILNEYYEVSGEY